MHLKKIMKNLNLPLKIVISILVLFALFRTMDTSTLGQLMQQIDLSFWLLAMGMLFLQILALTFRWTDLVNLRKPQITYGSGLRMTVASQLASILLITSIGGVVVRIAMLMQSGISLAKSICVTVTDRLMTLFALVLLALIFLPAFRSFVDHPVFNALAMTGALTGLVIFLFVPLFFQESLRKLILSNRKIASAYGYLRDLVSDYPLLARITLTSLMGQVFYFLAVYFISLSAGAHIDILTLLCVLPVITLIASLPVSFGGWGIREGAFIYGLGLIGIPAEMAFLISIQIGILTMLSVVLAGLPALMHRDTLSLLFRSGTHARP